MEEKPVEVLVKPTHYRLYREIMEKEASQIRDLKKNINKGKSQETKDIINRYGAYIETKHKETMERIKRHKHEINELNAKHTAELYKQQRERHEKQVEKERFLIDFIKSLDPKTKRQAQSDYHERFGTFM